MTLSIATEGYLPGMTPMTLATEGYMGESVEASGGGGFYAGARRRVRADVLLRDYRRREKRQGMRTAEITPRKLFEALPKSVLREKITQIAKAASISRKAAREALAARMRIEITRARIERVEQLNQETLAMLLAAIIDE